MSTAKDRLYEVYEAYRHALEKRAQDLKDARTQAQVAAVLANLDKLQTRYFEAARRELTATGPAVEEAYRTATRANSEIRRAYQGAMGLARRIREMGLLVSAISNLVKTAAA